MSREAVRDLHDAGALTPGGQLAYLPSKRGDLENSFKQFTDFSHRCRPLCVCVYVHMYTGMCMHYACPSVNVNPDACTCVHRRVHHRCMSVSPSLVSFKSWEGADLLTMEAVRAGDTSTGSKLRAEPALPSPEPSPSPARPRTCGQCLVFCA